MSESHPLLALDSRNFTTTDNAALSLGNIVKSAANPLFREDFFARPPKRWEARLDNVYPSVIADEETGIFKCWYKSFIIDQASMETPLDQRPQTDYFGGQREEGLLYATSRDGLHWQKPALGLIAFEGSRANNIVMRRATHGLHAGGILHDTHDPDPARRYKFLHRNPRAQRMASCFSRDGLTWSQPYLWPQHDAAGDTHNNAIRSSRLNKYIGITRGWRDGLRVALRVESQDFHHWSMPQEIMRGADKHDQIYSMPIIEYANLFIGLPAIFHKGNPSANDWDTVDTELAWSADSVNWQRICPGQPFIPRGHGSYPHGDYDCGCVYASAPILRADKILIYYGGSNGLHNNWRESSLNLATLTIDRFARIAPRDKSRQTLLTTAPLRLRAETITVNVDIAAGGSIRAALLNSSGSPLPGFALEDSQPLKRGGLACELRWADHPPPAPHDGPLRIVFALDDAKLYAISGLTRMPA